MWKKESKIWRLKQFIENLSLFIKECYRIAWNVEKIQKVKSKCSKEKKLPKNNASIKMCSVW